jgi:hypothetical protein
MSVTRTAKKRKKYPKNNLASLLSEREVYRFMMRKQRKTQRACGVEARRHKSNSFRVQACLIFFVMEVS